MNNKPIPYCRVIMKVGGSVVTLNSNKPNKDNINRIAHEVVQCSPNGAGIVIVHGGGSYTKGVLVRNNMLDNYFNQHQLHIVTEFRQVIKNLSEEIIKSFATVGIKAYTDNVSTLFVSDNGRIISCDILKIRDLLSKGLVILHGDVLVDKSRQYYACSGDQVVSYLSRVVKPETVLFLTDVDGVYKNYPPQTPSADPLPFITPECIAELSSRSVYKVGFGDMAGKLTEAMRCVYFSNNCYIMNGFRYGNITNAIQQKIFSGTRVLGWS